MQVFVLLAAQVGHGKVADRFHIINVAAGGECPVVSLHCGFGQKVVGNILDVVTVVKGLAGGVVRVDGPAIVAGLEALGAQLGAGGQCLDLHTGVVVIKLAVHAPALGSKQVADGITQSGLAAMAHVQGPGRVGRNKLHQHALTILRLKTKLRPLRQHFAHHLLFGCGFEADIDKARASDFHRINPGHTCWLRKQFGAQILS